MRRIADVLFMNYYGALEAGGTKMVLSVLDENGEILERLSIPTRAPSETMPVMISFFREHPVTALGIACFGPIDLNPTSETYGYITSTPKREWKNYPIVSEFSTGLGIPVGFDTDVNAAALAEHLLGAGKGLSSCLYVTIGTGIGGGLVIDGKPVHGLMHPELGHMLMPTATDDPSPTGFCPYHKGCLEGLASGPAIEKRWGIPAYQLPVLHPAWEIEAEYIAMMCVNAVMCFSPEIIILGGGVMQQEMLFQKIREKFIKRINGYITSMKTLKDAEKYIVAPGLGINSGVKGGWLLARYELERK